jgi:hypothetical protein
MGRRGNKTTSSWSKRGNNLDILNQFCWIRDFELEVLRLVVVEGEQGGYLDSCLSEKEESPTR